jgi:hypothetical protein
MNRHEGGRVMAIRSAQRRFEQLEPPSEWPDPDLSVLRLNRRPPPQLPVKILGEAWAHWGEHAARAAVAPSLLRCWPPPAP